MARISSQHSGVFLPANTPYERELVFEQIEFCARHGGEVHVDLDGRSWGVAACNPEAGRLCSACRSLLSHLAYLGGSGEPLCSRCARIAWT